MVEAPLIVCYFHVLQWIHWDKQTFVFLLQIWPPPQFLYSHPLYSFWHYLCDFSQCVSAFQDCKPWLGGTATFTSLCRWPVSSSVSPWVLFFAFFMLRDRHCSVGLCDSNLFHTVWGAMNLKNKTPFSGERRHLNLGLSLPPTKDVRDSLERAESSVFVVTVMPFVVSI